MKTPLRNERLGTLLSAANLAPSGDNMQPWAFEVDEAESSIAVSIDEARDTSPMNAGQRMSRLACGAAIENIVATAKHNSWDVDIHWHEEGSRVASVVVAAQGDANGTIPDAISRRHTNRRVYAGTRLSDSDAIPLRAATGGEDDVDAIWVIDRQAIQQIAVAIGRADADMFGRQSYFRAFLSNVRFDLPPESPADEGLNLGALELSWLERKMLPAMKHAPASFLRSWPMRRTFRAKAERLVNSASGLCVIVARGARSAASIQVGRMMQRAWLHLTALAYQVQPMMSIPVLANSGELREGIATRKALVDSVHSAFGRYAEQPPAAILRFGMGSPASSRTGRRPTSQITHATHTPSLAGK
jgi:hypothetical protein